MKVILVIFNIISRLLRTFVITIVLSSLFSVSSALANTPADDHGKLDLRDVSYPEIGITTGAAYVSMNVGYWYKRVGLRLSGGYLGKDKNELKINLGYKLSDSESRLQSMNLVLGKIVGSDPGADYDYSYVGVAYGLNYRGFFFELGIAKDFKDNIGNLDDDPFIPCGTIGYIYRFTP